MLSILHQLYRRQSFKKLPQCLRPLLGAPLIGLNNGLMQLATISCLTILKAIMHCGNQITAIVPTIIQLLFLII